MLTKRSRVLALFAIAALGVAACGGDDGGEADVSETSLAGGDTATTATEGATTAAPASDPSAPDAATSTPGGSSTSPSGGSGEVIAYSDSNQFKADVDRTGQTITVGLTNDEGPAFSLPEMRIGIETAVDMINGNGGINGAQIKLDECISDTTPEGAINCANQFVEQGVDMAVYGIEINIDAAMPIYEDAGIPVIADFAYGDNQAHSSTSWATGSALGAWSLWPLMGMQSLGATTVAFVDSDIPIKHQQADEMQAWGDRIGVKVVPIFVDSAAPDFTGAVQTALDAGAEAIISYPAEPSCSVLIKTARQLDFDGPIVTACNQYITELTPAQATDTYVLGEIFLPPFAELAPASTQKNIAAYVDAMTAAGHEDLINTYAARNFGSFMDTATVLDTIDAEEVNAESIIAAFAKDQQVPTWAGPDMNCGIKAWAAQPVFCRSYLMLIGVHDDGGTIAFSQLNPDNDGFYFDPELAAQSADIKAGG